MREVGEGNQTECEIGDSNVSDRTAENEVSVRDTKRAGATNDGFMEMACSLTKLVEIMLTVTDSTIETKHTVHSQNKLDCDAISTLILLCF